MRYPFRAYFPTSTTGTFVSTGLRGRIDKIIDYTYLPDLGLWNFGFGDLDTAMGQVSDKAISANGDGRKNLSKMKTLQEIIDSERDDIKVDPTLTERYGDGPLFPHKIERIRAIVKGTVLDPAVKSNKAEQANLPTPM